MDFSGVPVQIRAFSDNINSIRHKDCNPAILQKPTEEHQQLLTSALPCQLGILVYHGNVKQRIRLTGHSGFRDRLRQIPQTIGMI